MKTKFDKIENFTKLIKVIANNKNEDLTLKLFMDKYFPTESYIVIDLDTLPSDSSFEESTLELYYDSIDFIDSLIKLLVPVNYGPYVGYTGKPSHFIIDFNGMYIVSSKLVTDILNLFKSRTKMMAEFRESAELTSDSFSEEDLKNELGYEELDNGDFRARITDNIMWKYDNSREVSSIQVDDKYYDTRTRTKVTKLKKIADKLKEIDTSDKDKVTEVLSKFKYEPIQRDTNKQSNSYEYFKF